jgi:hypothetical protein
MSIVLLVLLVLLTHPRTQNSDYFEAMVPARAKKQNYSFWGCRSTPRQSSVLALKKKLSANCQGCKSPDSQGFKSIPRDADRSFRAVPSAAARTQTGTARAIQRTRRCDRTKAGYPVHSYLTHCRSHGLTLCHFSLLKRTCTAPS